MINWELHKVQSGFIYAMTFCINDPEHGMMGTSIYVGYVEQIKKQLKEKYKEAELGEEPTQWVEEIAKSMFKDWKSVEYGQAWTRIDIEILKNRGFQ